MLFGDVAARAVRPEIFSQGDREIGSFFGFPPPSAPFGATQALSDRCGGMPFEAWDLSEKVIAACIEVHNVLGPGLLEAMYEAALGEELAIRAIPFQRQKAIAVTYKGKSLEQSYRLDLIVEQRLLIEIKAVDNLLPVHVAQLATYLELAGVEHGLLVNFNAVSIRHGLRRLSRTPKTFRSPDLPAKKSRPA